MPRHYIALSLHGTIAHLTPDLLAVSHFFLPHSPIGMIHKRAGDECWHSQGSLTQNKIQFYWCFWKVLKVSTSLFDLKNVSLHWWIHAGLGKVSLLHWKFCNADLCGFVREQTFGGFCKWRQIWRKDKSVRSTPLPRAIVWSENNHRVFHLTCWCFELDKTLDNFLNRFANFIWLWVLSENAENSIIGRLFIFSHFAARRKVFEWNICQQPPQRELSFQLHFLINTIEV